MSKSTAVLQTPSTIADVKIAKSRQERTPGDTSKSKRSLGIPEEFTIAWIPFGLPYEENNILTALAKKRGVSKHSIGQTVLAEWWSANKSALTEEADEFLIASEKTSEELKKQLDRTLAMADRLRKSIEAKSSV